MTVKCSQPEPGFGVGEDCCLAFSDHILGPPLEHCCQHHPSGVLRETLGSPAHDPGQSAGHGAEGGAQSPAPETAGEPSVKNKLQPDGAGGDSTAGVVPGSPPAPDVCVCTTGDRTWTYLTQQCGLCHRELMQGPADLVIAEFVKLSAPHAELKPLLIQHLKTIRECAAVMEHKVASIYDKTSVIEANVSSMLKLLGDGSELVKRKAVETDDIGQGEGCEGGKCVVKRP